MITRVELNELISKSTAETIDIGKIIFKKECFSRSDGMDQSAIVDYSKNIITMPPILINKNRVIINGVHRYHALLKAGQSKANVNIIDLPETDIDIASYILDDGYGVRRPEKDKKRLCIKRYSADPEANKLLMQELKVAERTFYEWTADIRKERQKEINRCIAISLLHPFKTQEQVAEDFGVSQQTVSHFKNRLIPIFATIAKISNCEEKQRYLQELQRDDMDFLEDYLMFTPYLYGNWNLKSKDGTNDRFGHFPKVFMDNILYRHTKPFDIIYDAFAGEGTTIDSCNFMFRKCICSDLNPPAHRTEIFQHDVANGIPEKIKIGDAEYKMIKPDLIFLDPPYWIQAEKKYSESKSDLGNMSLEDFNNTMSKLFDEITKKKIERIALVIQPTEYKNDFKFVDHFADFHAMICKNYMVEKRYDLPYSTEQYNAQMVEKSKEKNVALNVLRDLVIWKRK